MRDIEQAEKAARGRIAEWWALMRRVPFTLVSVIIATSGVAYWFTSKSYDRELASKDATLGTKDATIQMQQTALDIYRNSPPSTPLASAERREDFAHRNPRNLFSDELGKIIEITGQPPGHRARIKILHSGCSDCERIADQLREAFHWAPGWISEMHTLRSSDRVSPTGFYLLLKDMNRERFVLDDNEGRVHEALNNVGVKAEFLPRFKAEPEFDVILVVTSRP